MKQVHVGGAPEFVKILRFVIAVLQHIPVKQSLACQRSVIRVLRVGLHKKLSMARR